MTRTIIGICGPLGSGKTTLAKQITSRHAFMRLGFADPLKSMLHTLFTLQGCDVAEAADRLWGGLKESPTIYLNGETSRRAMQTLGTEWGRNMMGPDFWVNIWKRAVEAQPETNFVVDDLRFQSEAAAIRSLGGKIILVNCTGFGPNTHASEAEYLQIREDIIIYNPITCGGNETALYTKFQQTWNERGFDPLT